jgi:hypothetical protein
VTGDGLLLFPSESGGTFARPCLVQGLACGSHGGDESLLLSVRGSDGGLSRGRGVVLLPLGSAAVAAATAACCSSTERLEVLSSMIDKTVVVRGGGGWQRTLGLGQR